MTEHKDWTWVLDRPCDECGYDSALLEREQLAAAVRVVAAKWRDVLSRPAVAATGASGERTWSVLEYGCHVRDVFDLFEGRIRDMLKARKPPTFRNWDQDIAAADGAYGDQEPPQVAYDLASNAGKVASLLDRVDGDEWKRTGGRADGPQFTVESIVRYMLHDVEHHLFDVEQLVEA